MEFLIIVFDIFSHNFILDIPLFQCISISPRQNNLHALLTIHEKRYLYTGNYDVKECRFDYTITRLRCLCVSHKIKVIESTFSDFPSQAFCFCFFDYNTSIMYFQRSSILNSESGTDFPFLAWHTVGHKSGIQSTMGLGGIPPIPNSTRPPCPDPNSYHLF